MKTFFNIVTKEKYRKYSGDYIYTLEIYRIRKNVPLYIGSVETFSCNTKGRESEVLRFLKTYSFGISLKQYKAFFNGYYRTDIAKENGFIIYNL